MPRLLHLNVCASVESTGRIAEDIGCVAIDSGWDSWIAYGRYAGKSKSQLIKACNKMSVYEHYFESRFLDKEGLASRTSTKKLIKNIKKISPDIISIHNIHDHWLNYQILFEYLNQTNIKVVWTFHDCWAFTGHCCHFVECGCNKWQTECGSCPMRNRFVDRSQENFMLKKQLFASNKNLTIVPVSQWMGDFVKKSFLKDKNIRIIRNGIDLNIFCPERSNRMNDGKFRIIAVSNVWLAYKGIYDIFKLRTLLSDDYEITVVGLQKKQLKMLPPGIRGITRTQNIHQLVDLYNESDVFINPTYADTFPTVNLEALACGTPVITYKTGGSPETIDEKTGVVIPQGDIEAMAAAIKEMKIYPLSREECRKRALANFDKTKCFDKYIELYNELLEKS